MVRARGVPLHESAIIYVSCLPSYFGMKNLDFVGSAPPSRQFFDTAGGISTLR